MNLQPVTHVSERLLPLTPVCTTGEGWGGGKMRTRKQFRVNSTSEHDVQSLHAAASNAGALFQVASQFNLLEMMSPEVTPEQGVGRNSMPSQRRQVYSGFRQLCGRLPKKGVRESTGMDTGEYAAGTASIPGQQPGGIHCLPQATG